MRRLSPLTAVCDACVLYPAPLRDLLIWLGLSGLFRARWSAQIHDEWKRNLLRNRPDLSASQLDRTAALMDSAIPDALRVSAVQERQPCILRNRALARPPALALQQLRLGLGNAFRPLQRGAGRVPPAR